MAIPEPAEHAAPAPAFYALGGGGWRDWWTLLHPPYTAWHLSTVAIGAAVAPALDLHRLAATLVAFFLAVGIGAHALDELHGRPLRTRISSRVLGLAGAASIVLAIGIGIIGIADVGSSLIAFIAFGAFIVCAYNLESFGGRFHNDAWFALSWGGFPALTGYWAQHPALDPAAIAIAAAGFFLSIAQRSLSTPVRALRRRTTRVDGTVTRSDGTIERLDRAGLMAPAERALRALSWAMVLLAAGLVGARALSGP